MTSYWFVYFGIVGSNNEGNTIIELDSDYFLLNSATNLIENIVKEKIAIRNFKEVTEEAFLEFNAKIQ